MEVQTGISRKLSVYSEQEAYDSQAKALIGDKSILGKILTYCIREFDGKTSDKPSLCIAEDVKIGKIPVYPGETNANLVNVVIKERNSEDRVPYEGCVTFDLLSDVYYDAELKNKVIVDCEIQKKFNPGYPIVTRGIFYVARKISSQLGREFSSGHYEDIKKVYSIWICLNAPRKAENTLNRYRIVEENVVGYYYVDEKCYDLMEVVLISLSKNIADKNRSELKLHRMLGVLFAPRMSLADKKDILEREYGILMTKEIKGRLDSMCNLGEGIYEMGIEQARADIVKRMYDKGYSVADISEIVGQKEADVQTILDSLLAPV